MDIYKKKKDRINAKYLKRRALKDIIKVIKKKKNSLHLNLSHPSLDKHPKA